MPVKRNRGLSRTRWSRRVVFLERRVSSSQEGSNSAMELHVDRGKRISPLYSSPHLSPTRSSFQDSFRVLVNGKSELTDAVHLLDLDFFFFITVHSIICRLFFKRPHVTSCPRAAFWLTSRRIRHGNILSYANQSRGRTETRALGRWLEIRLLRVSFLASLSIRAFPFLFLRRRGKERDEMRVVPPIRLQRWTNKSCVKRAPKSAQNKQH